MPGEVIDRPNPPPAPSTVPDYVADLLVKLEKPTLADGTNQVLAKYRRAANYIAAAMIFLQDNVLLQRDFQFDDIKPRLLGHWGTCPGLTLVYSHLNILIEKHNLDMIYVVGPGHGAPALLANLWIEGSLAKFYPECSQDAKGLHNLISRFSTTGGFPSHINAETPGAIHEGGELGYALSVSFGAVMDNPDLVVTCIVGDGECEIGPIATAWHSYKYIDPAELGAMLPIVYVNGFKISERTIYGCMDDKEMAALFTGHSPKSNEFRKLPGVLQEWLESYKPKELFKDNGDVIDEIKNLVPKKPERRLGQNKKTYDLYQGLQPINWRKFEVKKGGSESSIKTIDKLLEQVIKDNPKDFRIFSPNEFESNKLDVVLNSTNRNFQWD
ncbi:hypothetical protein LTR72_010908 [Exophiala xenobiotica]|nr:hypothetical protein LTR72_010908 [Exophiala xenobiotica]KAK5401354.1 hypothetical protein LTR79_001873 [Exophiala xenobiotica]KAK5460184.1 hypothetical protein LTR20_007491 [Exophiala xenobiotica]KAK5506426.1 hypothetical protein LTR83_000979 [Exophiala xenobiotica]KAK5518717.1 hypothetical protein LTR07_005687 [Exophiala xenobiotica]